MTTSLDVDRSVGGGGSKSCTRFQLGQRRRGVGDQVGQRTGISSEAVVRPSCSLAPFPSCSRLEAGEGLRCTVPCSACSQEPSLVGGVLSLLKVGHDGAARLEAETGDVVFCDSVKVVRSELSVRLKCRLYSDPCSGLKCTLSSVSLHAWTGCCGQDCASPLWSAARPQVAPPHLCRCL